MINLGSKTLWGRLAGTLLAALLLAPAGTTAKELKDTLFSGQGDRVILTYSQAQSGGQLTLSFKGVQKKLNEAHLKKYKKLDEVAVVFFDRTGGYREMKFDGQATSAFMVPSDVTYSPSTDGYFLLQDNPSLQFTLASDNVQLAIPLYLAHYEGKRHYKVFTQCGTLQIDAKGGTKSTGGKGGSSVAQGGGQTGEVVISTEELVDEGLSPADEAAIRISSLKQMLEKATKVPFSEELTHEASMLRELRFKISDEAVGRQIAEALQAYDDKKQELEQQADAGQAAADAKAAADAQAAQARQDSIAAAQAQQASDDKRNMMWLIGGLGGLFLLFTIGKQVLQGIKSNKLQKKQQQMQQKMQKDMMQKMQELTEKVNPKAPAAEAPPQVNEQAGRAMQKETDAARQRLREILAGKKGQAAGTEPDAAAAPRVSITPGRKASMNDQIPTNYKRLQKKTGGDSPKKS